MPRIVEASPTRSFRRGLAVQIRVFQALTIRELTTRFGRENIGFLWIMVEPLLFTGLVAVIWRVMKGPEEFGVSIVGFVVTGYIPLTLFRHGVARSVSIFRANSALMYHRQVHIFDFVIVRFFIEMIGAMMAFSFVAPIIMLIGDFPVPSDVGLLISGWFLYSLFVLSLCFVIAPLSEMSEVLEKIIPVTTYVTIPFSGSFTLMQAMTPTIREYLIYSPFVGPMEMMRAGIWGGKIQPYYDVPIVLWWSGVSLIIGLLLCRYVRKNLAVE